MSKTGVSYISIREDDGLRSLSLNERNFLRAGALSTKTCLRIDGRSPGEIRKVKMHLSRCHNGAECTVQWGETRISAKIVGILQPPPSDDRPSEGVVSIAVDTSPMASTAFGMMPPLTTTPGDSDRLIFSSSADDSQRLLGNRILRCLERTILLGGALDTEALCVQSGAWVWKLSLSIRILDHGGNLLDSSVLASMAVLRHYRKPQVDMVEGGGMPLLIHSDAQEPTPLPLHHTPLSVSFALIHSDDVALSTSSSMTVAVLVDPTEREELVQTGSISLAMNLHSEVCLLDFGGGCELKPSQLKKCFHLAEKCIVQLCQTLESTLKEADEKAQNERLHRLQKQQQHPNLPPLPSDPIPEVPFWKEDVAKQVDMKSLNVDSSSEIKEAQIKMKDQAEEAYRLRALEYNQGHIAAKVKEKADDRKHEGGTLLAAMLKSAQETPDEQMVDNQNVMEVEPSSNDQNTKNPMASKNQISEFEEFAKTMKGKIENKKTDSMVFDDEEEVSTMLKSEFESVQVKKMKEEADEDDVDDLALAIKKKKKDKKKKKTK